MTDLQIRDRLFSIIFTCLLLGYSMHSYSQGCSDAGFCTMGAMKPNQSFSGKTKLKVISVEGAQYIGYTKFGDVILTYFTDINFIANSKTTFQVKLPYTAVFGKLANTNGTGDISISATRNLYSTEKSQINFTIGGKIPTNNANKKVEDNRPLPMYYQTSLGTYDLVGGLSWINRKWLVAVGYQQPLNSIDNTFKWGAWAGRPLLDKVQQYPVSNFLKRGNDVMFRVERNFRFSRFNTYVGLLPIYRLTQDIITSPQTLKRTKVNGSDGLAMTGLYGFGYRFNTKASIKCLFGVSLVRRKTNPDGLSREFVNSISFEYRF